MNNQEVIDQLVPVYMQMTALSDAAKDILKVAKDSGLDHTNLAKIAKAKADAKLDELFDKTESLLTTIKPFIA